MEREENPGCVDSKTTECRIIRFCRSVITRPEFSVLWGISTDRGLKTLENFQYEPTVWAPGLGWCLWERPGGAEAGQQRLGDSEQQLPTLSIAEAQSKMKCCWPPPIFNKVEKGKPASRLKKIISFSALSRTTHWLWKSDSLTISL